MKRTKVKCLDCGVEVSASNATKHKNSKQCLKNQKEGITIRTKGECPHCQFSTNHLSISERANHARWCEKNPKREEYKRHLDKLHDDRVGVVGWNKGLTKETDVRMKKISETYSNKIKSGEIIPSWLGRKHTDASKKLMQEKAIASDHQRVCKKTRPYIMIDGSTVMLDSAWEVTVAENLDKAGVRWVRPKPLKWVDKMGISRNYFSDFYIPEWNVYLDPKNEYAKEHQAEKLNYLKSHYNNIFILNENQLDVESIKQIIGI